MGSERRAAGFALLVTLLVSASAQAQQPTASQKETARSLMAEGRARRDRSDARGALESFRAADALMHVPTTGYELARAQVALGELVEARDTLRSVLRRSSRPDDPRPFAEARANAQELDDDLARRIPSIQVVLQGAPAAATTVELDGVALPPEAALEPLKVNPGHHAVRARAGGATGLAEAFVIERETKRVAVTLPPPLHSELEPSPATEPTPGRSHAPRTLAWMGFGLAGIGAAVGSVAGMTSISKTNAVKSSCVNDHCPSWTAGDLDSARSTAAISTIAFAVAGAGLAVAVVALVVGEEAPHAEPSTARARITPWIGPGAAGVRGSF